MMMAFPELKVRALDMKLSTVQSLPEDSKRATLVGRIWRPDLGGPSVVALKPDGVFDITSSFATMRDLCEAPDPAFAVKSASGEKVGDIAELLANSVAASRNVERPWLLAPIDLQAVKAAGVTFAVSLLERLIEERARGNPETANAIRDEIIQLVGPDFAKLKPGSAEAMRLKDILIQKQAWSQYLEVGIGPDAEIFTKAQPLSSVGTGADIGIHPSSTWNNPEPEAVLVVNSAGRTVGASLGNDVNLRDIEGRSALLLSKAKDNNASCSIGPFIRLFDQGFDLSSVREMTITLHVDGCDGFVLNGSSTISRISRDPEDLITQMMGAHHQYPDGAVLFLGTLFAPVDDRDAPGQGFTHKMGDIVTISAPLLGALVNRVRSTEQCEPWRYGTGHLMRNLAERRLL
jgi:fumarylacetoacetate (FAA) hydrolase family protein